MKKNLFTSLIIIGLFFGGSTAVWAVTVPWNRSAVGTMHNLYAGDNVGVGTTIPQNRLDVSGSMAVGSYAGLNAAPSNGLIVSGNVGIGTTSPSATLSVKGSVNFSDIPTFGRDTLGYVEPIVPWDVDTATPNATYAPGVYRVRSSTQNFLVNSGFESWLAGTSASPDEWTLAGDATVSRSTAATNGSYAAQIVFGTANTGELYQPINISTLVDYTYSCYTKRISGSGNARLVAQRQDSPFTEFASVGMNADGATNLVALTVKPSAGTLMRFSIKSSDATASTWAIDECIMQESRGVATTYQSRFLDDISTLTTYGSITFAQNITVASTTATSTFAGNIQVRATTTTQNLVATSTVWAGDGSALSPSFSFAAEPDLGIYRSAAGTLTFADGTVGRMSFSIASNSTLLNMTSLNNAALASGIGFAPAQPPAGSTDVYVGRDGAANTLSQRNGTNGQSFRVYNTISGGLLGSSNYERGVLSWASNVLNIGTENQGTGSARGISFVIGSTTKATIDTVGNFGVGTTTVATTTGIQGALLVSGMGSFAQLTATGTVTMKGLDVEAGASDDAVCINATTFRIERNTGATTCLLSTKESKYNIKPLDIGLKEFLKLKPKSFISKADNKPHMGLIAEDMFEIEPRLVVLNEQGKPKTIRYEEFTGWITKTIQDFYGQFQKLLARVTGLENKVNKQEIKIRELEQRLLRLEK